MAPPYCFKLQCILQGPTDNSFMRLSWLFPATNTEFMMGGGFMSDMDDVG